MNVVVVEVNMNLLMDSASYRTVFNLGMAIVRSAMRKPDLDMENASNQPITNARNVKMATSKIEMENAFNLFKIANFMIMLEIALNVGINSSN